MFFLQMSPLIATGHPSPMAVLVSCLDEHTFNNQKKVLQKALWWLSLLRSRAQISLTTSFAQTIFRFSSQGHTDFCLRHCYFKKKKKSKLNLLDRFCWQDMDLTVNSVWVLVRRTYVHARFYLQKSGTPMSGSLHSLCSRDQAGLPKNRISC